MTCIIAEEQTAGRGQFGRKWVSPKGVNLYVSFYFHLPLNSQKIETLAIFMAKCLKAVLEEQGVTITLKWPNDLLLNGKKIGGILCETVFYSEYIEVVLGFGLNVNMEAAEFEKIDQAATSLREETDLLWDREALLDSITCYFSNAIKYF